MIHCFSYESNYITGGTKVTDPPSLNITEVASLDFLPACLANKLQKGKYARSKQHLEEDRNKKNLDYF